MKRHVRISRIALAAAAVVALAGPAGAAASGGRAVVEVRTVAVGAPGNPSVAIVPFTDAVYQSCAEAPQTQAGCQLVGGVDFRYGIGQLEITVGQWVKFLNTVDPTGRDPHRLYDPSESSSAWPKYGQIEMSSRARRGRHYSVAYPEWADKPYGFANFLRAARFVNSLYNGRVLSKQAGGAGDSSQPGHARPLDRRRHQRRDAAVGELPRLGPAGAELVPGGRGTQRLLERQPVRDRPDHLRRALPGQPRHRR